MRHNAKYFIVVFCVICGLIGSGLNSRLISQLDRGTPVSDKSIQINRCTQALLWTPTPLIIGLLFVLYPNKIVQWFQKDNRPKDIGIIHKAYLIFIGLFFLLLPIPFDGNWAECGKVLHGFLGK